MLRGIPAHHSTNTFCRVTNLLEENLSCGVREEEIKESVENGGRKKATYSERQPDWNSTRGWTH